MSYSHQSDGALGPALRDALHDFARPWYQLRALRVFCDRSSLQSNPDLWATITHALDSSGTFILLASPASATAPWVRRELQHWMALSPRRPILIVQTGGEIAWDSQRLDFDWDRTDALPDVLRGWFDAEPMWIDLRSPVDGSMPRFSLRDPAFLDVVATLASALHKRPKDELIGSDIKKFRAARRFRRFSWTSLSLLLVAALIGALVAVVQRNSAVRERDNAIFSKLTAQVDRFTDTDVSLAAELALVANRMRPDDDMYVKTVEFSSGALASVTPVPARRLAVNAERGILAASSDDTIRLMRIAADGGLQPAGEPPAVNSAGKMAISPDGATLAVSDATGFTLTAIADPRRPFPLGRGTEEQPGDANVMVISPDGRSLVISYEDGGMHLWDIADPSRPVALGVVSGHSAGVISLAFSPDGRTLASGSIDSTMKLWNAGDAGRLALLSAPQTATGYVTALAFSPD